ncbi:MAG: M4 family metallopeptidase [Saprospiraceae bacterium]|nr:M4 family metallopeptidase [Saprospiraceae bacterium]
MCHRSNHHHVNGFNPPRLQTDKLPANARVDKEALQAERKEARRNRRRAKRLVTAYQVHVLQHGETVDKNIEVYSGVDASIKISANTKSPKADEDMEILFDYTGKIFDFFAKEFRRNSINGGQAGTGVPVIVKAHHRTSTNRHIANSFWDLRDRQILAGEGDEVRRSYARDLTVIAHEYTHGVIQHTQKGLGKRHQSGALNESLADIFACMIVQYYNWQNGEFPDTSAPVPAQDADWKVGAYIFKEDDIDYIEGMAVRSLREPGKKYNHSFLSNVLGGQPHHMDQYRTNYGPYINCGIPSHAFYLLADSFGGFSWEKAGQIWYNTLLANEDPFTDFKRWAKLTVKEAQKLFGNNDPAVELTKEAWKKVGIRT